MSQPEKVLFSCGSQAKEKLRENTRFQCLYSMASRNKKKKLLLPRQGVDLILL
jgi:hypothetical protein